jgi:hypothetical protein
MAPIKIEDNIREQLQDREIQPSKDAWNKLEARLGPQRKQGITRTAWFAIAASFVGILILASVFLNDNSTGQENQLVNQENPAIESKQSITEKQLEEVVPEKIQEEVAFEVPTSEEIKTKAPVPVEQRSIASTKVEKKPEVKTIQDDIAVNNSKTEQLKTNDLIQSPVIDEGMFIESKVDEIVAEVKKIEKTNVTATPEEIDALLIQAQREIGNRRILNSQTRKVDAAALLMDVEFELERSFRDKVFDALGDGYKKIRTAMVERNY